MTVLLAASLFILVIIPSGNAQDGLKLYLYNRKNPTQPIDMLREGLTALDPSSRIKVLIHGITENSQVYWYKSMVEEYLKSGPYDIIAVDWLSIQIENLGPDTTNLIARRGGEAIGDFLLKLIYNVGVRLKHIHLLGFSRGAHAAGFAAKKVFQITGRRIRRITAMDPTGGSAFESPAIGPADRLDEDDAFFVDVIHTNAGGKGFNNPLGKVDFYINGGAVQPGCNLVIGFLTNLCSHIKSHDYFVQSINTLEMTGTSCNSWKDFNEGYCNRNRKITFGHNVEQDARGVYFVKLK